MAAGTVGLAGCGAGSDGGDGATATRTQTETPTRTQTQTPPRTQTGTATGTPTGTDAGDGVAQTVAVGGDGLRFTPESFEVAAGAAVEWVWEGNSHNIVPDAIPDGATWQGTPGGAGDVYDEGYRHRAWFDVPGTYTYYCAPHRGVGMAGSFTVVE